MLLSELFRKFHFFSSLAFVIVWQIKGDVFSQKKKPYVIQYLQHCARKNHLFWQTILLISNFKLMVALTKYVLKIETFFFFNMKDDRLFFNLKERGEKNLNELWFHLMREGKITDSEFNRIRIKESIFLYEGIESRLPRINQYSNLIKRRAKEKRQKKVYTHTYYHIYPTFIIF